VPHPSKRPVPPSTENAFPPGSVLGFLADRSQLDFEIEFFGKLLAVAPAFAEVLRVQAGNLTTKGRLQDGLAVDKQLVATRPADPTAHYNLACRYALLKQGDMALGSLRKAIELGYRDFQFMEADHDLDSIRKDPRFRQLVREYRNRAG
jgi:tetratricopeptide (TPR) repeat protein